MAEEGTLKQMIWRMVLAGLFLAFLLFIAFPSPIPYDDAGGLIGLGWNLLAFLKAFMIGKSTDKKTLIYRPSGEIIKRSIPGYDSKNILGFSKSK